MIQLKERSHVYLGFLDKQTKYSIKCINANKL